MQSQAIPCAPPRDAAVKPPVELVCAQCSTAFTRKASDIKKGALAFCSTACVTDSRRVKPVELVCAQCNQAFTRLRSVDARPSRAGYVAFCSQTCVGASQRRGDVVTRTCQGCSKPFEIPPSRVAQGKGTYCSTACRKQPLPSAVTVASTVTVTKRPLAKPGSILPKYLDRLPLIDAGSHVSCHRCGLLRERGVRCSCERPMWDEVSA